MNANDFQKWTIDVAVYPGAGTGDNRELVYLGLGLTSEAGEVAGKIKKLVRDDQFEPMQIAHELGDVLWYVARLGSSLGYDLETLMEWNYKKLNARKENGTIRGSGDAR